MTLAQHLTRYIDFFYIRPIRAVLPLQTFRYAVCGGIDSVELYLFEVFCRGVGNLSDPIPSDHLIDYDRL